MIDLAEEQKVTVSSCTDGDTTTRRFGRVFKDNPLQGFLVFILKFKSVVALESNVIFADD